MKEDDIRPAHLRVKVQELFRKEAKALLAYASEFVEVACPACAEGAPEIYLQKDGYQYKRCRKCRTAYVSPRPTPELLKQYYAKNEAAHFWQKEVFPRTRQARTEGIYKARADLIQKVVAECKGETNSFMDVGAGSGIFGQEIARRRIFKTVYLVEPGPIPLKNTATFRVIQDSIENVELSEAVDFITNFELIEHLFSPEDFLRKIHSLLSGGAFFLFSTPNLEGFELLTVHDKSPNLAGPDHLTLFNPDSIRVLLDRTGFNALRVWTPGELDCDIVRNKHLEGVLDLKTDPFLYHILIERPESHMAPFQIFLKENNLSSHMMVLARKKS